METSFYERMAAVIRKDHIHFMRLLNDMVVEEWDLPKENLLGLAAENAKLTHELELHKSLIGYQNRELEKLRAEIEALKAKYEV